MAELQPSERCQNIPPFYVMALSKAAAQRPKTAEPPLIALNIGEPDFSPAPRVVAAAEQAIQQGVGYTPALGLPELRQSIAQWYATRWSVAIHPDQIVVTAGASAALQLVCLALLNAGDEVIMPDPGYPCNQVFVRMAQAQPKPVFCGTKDRFTLNPSQFDNYFNEKTKAILLASPANPTGTALTDEALFSLVEQCVSKRVALVMDEIYLALHHGQPLRNVWTLAQDDLTLFTINSFSKYFHMTGWRLGWIVAPLSWIAPLERLAQHLYICPSAIAQRAALACFHPESLVYYDAHQRDFTNRLHPFVLALEQAGITIPVIPDGAFYVWADVSAWCECLGFNMTDDPCSGSWKLAFYWLHELGLIVTPGRDFCVTNASRYMRFSIATAFNDLMDAAQRLKIRWHLLNSSKLSQPHP